MPLLKKAKQRVIKTAYFSRAEPDKGAMSVVISCHYISVFLFVFPFGLVITAVGISSRPSSYLICLICKEVIPFASFPCGNKDAFLGKWGLTILTSYHCLSMLEGFALLKKRKTIFNWLHKSRADIC